MAPIRLGTVTRPPAVEIEDLATPGGRCPACGEPLFPWIEVEDEVEGAPVRHVVDRCENCRLVTERGDAGEAVADIVEQLAKDVARDGSAELTLPNGRSWQSSLGSAHWAGIRLPQHPAILNPKALALLLEHEDLEIQRLSFPAPAGIAQLTLTFLNLITFNRDFLPRALRREVTPFTSAHQGLGFGIDALATVVMTIPLAAIAALVEAPAILFRHGGVLRARIRRPS